MKPKGKILFTSIPKLSQLTYFLALIDFSENQNVFSYHNWQKIKARHLIENDQDIIVAPVERKLSYIHLIVSKNQTYQELEKLMAESKLTLLGPHPLPNDIYLKALFYSLTTKISSEWVQVDNCLVKSCFLNRRNAIEGVQLQLTLTDGWLTVFVKALKLKLPFISLIDLGVDTQTLYNNGLTVVNQNVYVLPSFRPATAINIHLKIPPGSPFQNYEDLRSHWRNLYGYILPESSEGMLYVEVNFEKYITSMSYLYPIICICSFKPIRFQCNNDFEIITEFSDSWRRNIPSICRSSVQILMEPNGLFPPYPKFHLASEIPEDFETSFLFLSQSSAIPVSPMVTQKQEEPFKCFPIDNPRKKGFCNAFDSPTLKKPTDYSSQEKNIKKAAGVKKRSSPELPDELNQELEEAARSKDLQKIQLPLLKKICKKHEIPLKAKDKKSCVMEKIYNFFAIS